jgi:hypothetical protein
MLFWLASVPAPKTKHPAKIAGCLCEWEGVFDARTFDHSLVKGLTAPLTPCKVVEDWHEESERDTPDTSSNACLGESLHYLDALKKYVPGNAPTIRGAV